MRSVVAGDEVEERRVGRIQDRHERWNRILCPHTATAAALRADEKDGDWIVVATAHPAKFAQIIEPLIGVQVAVPSALGALLERPTTHTQMPATLEALKLSIPASAP